MNAIPDRDVVVLGAGATPALSLGYSLPFSVYQHLMHLVRQPLQQDVDVTTAFAVAVARIRAVYLPIGPFNALEFGAAGAATSADLGAGLRARAAVIADAIGTATAEAEGAYRAERWPEHGPMLVEALERAHALLAPHKDELLTRLASALGVEAQTESYEVHLVPVCHEPTGGYSHPTVVSVAVFQGLHLVEAILHELAHVMMQAGREEPGALAAALGAACRRRKRPARLALELLHVFVFHATGEIVRERYGAEHVPHAQARGLYARASALLRAEVSEHVIGEIWAQRQEGPEVIAERLLDRVGGHGRTGAG
ncbi:hypothetical protein [Chondromyces apiculatus]|uniref:hypothetical protein n=1 Tax=Chondromyces apiculatus TaxID=51 RepID=UPI0012DF4230|nr:hypothetical protein [Chondromyces apiculatus]